MVSKGEMPGGEINSEFGINIYKQLYTNKMDDLEETDKFLERYNIPRLNQEEIENMNKPIKITEIETVIKKNLLDGILCSY